MKETGRKAVRDTAYYTHFLSQYFSPEKPLVKMFRTPSAGYLYDTGTNKIFQCPPGVFELMNLLLSETVETAANSFILQHGEEQFIEAAQEIADVIEAENILRVNRTSGLRFADYCNDLESLLKSTAQAINLELTQECNLRCRYCPYNHYVKDSRDFTPETMSDDTARKAIDLLAAHSDDSENISIGFYGGEPLLRFPFLKRCVAYAKEVFGGRELSFPITTNATLITPEIAEFLLTENFNVLVSIDGPKEEHDRFRKKKNGGGSFDETLAGLEMLAEKRREIKTGHIDVSVVYTPPFSANKLEKLNTFFKELEGLPELYVSITYPSEKTIPDHLIPKNGLVEDKNMSQWAFDKYKTAFDDSDSMVKVIIEKELARVMQRSVFSKPTHGYSLNACCIPGRKKCYITTDGRILVCEKMPHLAPAIGHVDTGFDIETIRRVYVDEYLEAGAGDCSGCWGLRLCQVCYIMAFDADGKLDMEKKRDQCRRCLDGQERLLTEFMTLTESEPGKLDYLYKKELV